MGIINLSVVETLTTTYSAGTLLGDEPDHFCRLRGLCGGQSAAGSCNIMGFYMQDSRNSSLFCFFQKRLRNVSPEGRDSFPAE